MVRRRLARGRPVRESLQAPLAWGEDALVSGGDRRHQDVVCVHIQRDVSNATYPTRRIQRDGALNRLHGDSSYATIGLRYHRPTLPSAYATIGLRYHRPSDEASAVGARVRRSELRGDTHRCELSSTAASSLESSEADGSRKHSDGLNVPMWVRGALTPRPPHALPATSPPARRRQDIIPRPQDHNLLNIPHPRIRTLRNILWPRQPQVISGLGATSHFPHESLVSFSNFRVNPEIARASTQEMQNSATQLSSAMMAGCQA
jgi:hypothetical protein